jgi:hypothetical protein
MHRPAARALTHISATLACGAERWGIIGFDTDARSAGWLDQMVAATTAVFALVRYVTDAAIGLAL